MLNKKLSDKTSYGRIVGIQYDLVSSEFAKRYAQVQIKTSQSYDKNAPSANGLFDNRMGTNDRNMPCATCRQSIQTCPGHEGMKELQIPMYIRNFIETVRLVLNSVCFCCGQLRLRARPSQLEAIIAKYPNRRARLQAIARESALYTVCGKDRIKVHSNRKPKAKVLTKPESIIGNESDQDESSTAEVDDDEQDDDDDDEWPDQDEGDDAGVEELEDVDEDEQDGLLSEDEEETEFGILDSESEDMGSKPRTKSRNQTVSNAKRPVPLFSSQSEKKTLPKDSRVLIGLAKKQLFKWKESRSLEDRQFQYKGCGCHQPKYTKEGGSIKATFTIEYDGKDSSKDALFPCFNNNVVYELLKKIHPVDAKILGFRRASPADLMMKTLLVPPIIVRPSVTRNEGSKNRGHDGLTTCLRNVLTRVIALERKLKPDFQLKFSQGQYQWFVITENGTTKTVKCTCPISQRHCTCIAQYKIETRGRRSGVAGVKQQTDTTHLTKSTRREQTISEAVASIQAELDVYFCGDKASTRSLRKRIIGKRGRIRGNLEGRRLNFTARTVITPNHKLSLYCLVIPRLTAKELTYPEQVSIYNFAHLSQLLRSKKVNFIRRDGELLHCKLLDTNTFSLQIGDIVLRQLQDGDVVLFNRQPSLHAPSISAMFVRIGNGKTFEFNLPNTDPLGADYDGDEMNLHVPQDLNAKAEAIYLMTCQEFIVSGQYSRPIMSNKQHSIISPYLMTRSDTFLSFSEFTQFILSFGEFLPTTESSFRSPLTSTSVIPAVMIKDANGKWISQYTGAQLFSFCLPKGIDYGYIPASPMRFQGKYTSHYRWIQTLHEYLDRPLSRPIAQFRTFYQYVVESKVLRHEAQHVLIRDSELLCGYPTNVHMGNVAGSLIHNMYLDTTPLITLMYLTGMQRLSNEFLDARGLSVSLRDTWIDPSIEARCKDVTSRALQMSKHEVDTWSHVDATKRESLQREILNLPKQFATNQMLQWLDANQHVYENQLYDLVCAGAKAKPENLTQMTLMLGQQLIFGDRMKGELPYFRDCPSDPESRGFIQQPFSKGLNVVQMIHQQMGTRDGLVDTAAKTSETGYLQRQLEKLMENVLVAYDDSVRGSKQLIIQFQYFNSGLDPKYTQRVPLPKDVLKVLGGPQWWTQIPPFASAKLQSRFLQEQLEERDHWTWLHHQWEDFWQTYQQVLTTSIFPTGHEGSVSSLIPYHRLTIGQWTDMDWTPAEFCNERSKLEFAWFDTVPAKRARPHIRSFQRLLFYTFLHPYVVFTHYKWNKRLWEEFQTKYTDVWFRRRIEPCSTVGIVAAQSTCEPCTQMTLRTFHSAGSEHGTILKQGIKMIKELLTGTHHPSQFVTEISCKPGTSAEDAFRYAQALPIRKLARYVTKTDIVSNPIHIQIQSPAERVLLNSFDQGWAPHILHFTLDKAKMISSGCTILGLKVAILSYLLRFLQKTKQTKYSLSNTVLLLGDIHGTNLYVCLHTTFPYVLEASNIIRKQLSPLLDTSVALQNSFLAFGYRLLNEIEVHGMKGITNARILNQGKPVSRSVWNSATRQQESVEQYKLQLDGVNLQELLLTDWVDPSTLWTSSLHDVLAVFGIEGLRFWLEEFLERILRSNGASINRCHLNLIADRICQSGIPVFMTRKSMATQDDISTIDESRDVLGAVGFEQPIEHLCSAAVFGEYDSMEGITSNMIMSNLSKFGTGGVVVLEDKNAMKYPDGLNAELFLKWQVSNLYTKPTTNFRTFLP